MAPLKAVAVLSGTSNVSGVIHFQEEGEGIWLALLCFFFFSCLDFFGLLFFVS
jgi:hypothetical protein